VGEPAEGPDLIFVHYLLLDYGKGYLGIAEPASAIQEVLNAIRRQREQRQAQHQ
jgi:hypothetical protein